MSYFPWYVINGPATRRRGRPGCAVLAGGGGGGGVDGVARGGRCLSRSLARPARALGTAASPRSLRARARREAAAACRHVIPDLDELHKPRTGPLLLSAPWHCQALSFRSPLVPRRARPVHHPRSPTAMDCLSCAVRSYARGVMLSGYSGPGTDVTAGSSARLPAGGTRDRPRTVPLMRPTPTAGSTHEAPAARRAAFGLSVL